MLTLHRTVASQAGCGGTLDRKLRTTASPAYPLYHTCNRQNKKKVTIVDDESKV